MKNKALLFGLSMLLSMSLSAKDIKTVVVTTQPQMHCENCEKKIKGNLRFEKGIKNRRRGDFPWMVHTATPSPN